MKDITQHHAIPTYLRPKQNLVIPLCAECHKVVHAQDMGTIKAFLYKIRKSLDTVTGMVARKKEVHDSVTINDIIKKGDKK